MDKSRTESRSAVPDGFYIDIKELEASDQKELMSRLGSLVIEYIVEFDTEDTPSDEEIFSDLVKTCSNIAEYTHDEGIKSILLLDRATRPAYLGIREAWQRKYPDEDRPSMHFINPTGFVDIRTGLGWDKENRMLKGQVIKKRGDNKLNQTDSFFATSRTKSAIQGDFINTFPNLIKNKNESLLVLDTCIHSGDSVRPVLNTLDSLGFSDVHFGVVDNRHNYSELQPDAEFGVGTALTCYPFLVDTMTNRSFGSVVSTKSPFPERVQMARELRQEASEIFSEAPDSWFESKTDQSVQR